MCLPPFIFFLDIDVVFYGKSQIGYTLWKFKLLRFFLFFMKTKDIILNYILD